MNVAVILSFPLVLLILIGGVIYYIKNKSSQLFYSVNELSKEVSNLKQELDVKGNNINISRFGTNDSLNLKDVNLMIDSSPMNFTSRFSSNPGINAAILFLI